MCCKRFKKVLFLLIAFAYIIVARRACNGKKWLSTLSASLEEERYVNITWDIELHKNLYTTLNLCEQCFMYVPCIPIISKFVWLTRKNYLEDVAIFYKSRCLYKVSVQAVFNGTEEQCRYSKIVLTPPLEINHPHLYRDSDGSSKIKLDDRKNIRDGFLYTIEIGRCETNCTLVDIRNNNSLERVIQYTRDGSILGDPFDYPFPFPEDQNIYVVVCPVGFDNCSRFDIIKPDTNPPINQLYYILIAPVAIIIIGIIVGVLYTRSILVKKIREENNSNNYDMVENQRISRKK